MASFARGRCLQLFALCPAEGYKEQLVLEMDDRTVPESFDAQWPIPFHPPRSCFLFFARRLVEAFSHLGHDRHEMVPLTSVDQL